MIITKKELHEMVNKIVKSQLKEQRKNLREEMGMEDEGYVAERKGSEEDELEEAKFEEAKKFIQKAIKRPGALTKKADAAGMSVRQFAEKHKHDGDLTGNQSRFYLNVLRKTHHDDDEE